MSRVGQAVSSATAKIPPRWQFAVFVGVVIAISLGLTVLSYTLYVVSGTAQLDLSRPGYKGALKEVSPVDTDDYSFSGTGPLDTGVLNDFKAKYDALTAKTKDVSKGYGVFDPGALSDEQLGLTQSGVTGPQ